MRRFLVVAASLFVVTALFFTGTRQAVGQDEKKAVEPDPGKAQGELPQEAIAAWEKAGAETGWMGPRWQLGVEFSKEQVGFHTGPSVPAFRFGPIRGGAWPEGLATLPQPEQAFGLELRRITTDENVKELARLKHLTWLHLSLTKITEEGLKELAGMKQLTALHLNVGSPLTPGTRPFTDADLKVLAGMTQLTALELPFTQVTDTGLKELAGLKQLTSLHLTNNKTITDAGLKELAGLERLTDLKLNMTRVSDAGLKELAPLKQLSILGLWYTKVTDAGLKELAGLEQLTMLTLSNTQVTGTGLKELTGLKRLTFLELKGTQITEDGLKELAGLKHLTTLYLTKTPVTEAGEAALHQALPQCRIRLVNGPRVAPGGTGGGL